MFNFSRHHTYEPALDRDEDRDLIALVNEARDPNELERVARMARSRQRVRHADASPQSHEPSRSRRGRRGLGRALSPRS